MKKFVWLLTLIVISTSLFTPAVAAINKDNIEEKFIYGCGVEENLKPYGDYVEEVVSESSGYNFRFLSCAECRSKSLTSKVP